MPLDDRKKNILKAIIEDYINTAEPVGSRTISKRHDLGLSSATIRNEMSDLEEMGFLVQPHTSSGRIPSDKGYRFYVDQLMKEGSLSDREIQSIKGALEVQINELSQLIRVASSVMSKVTNYISLATKPELTCTLVKAVQVVPIEDSRALVIVVFSGDIVRNNMMRFSIKVKPELLIYISNMLNDTIAGMTLDKLKNYLTTPYLREVLLNIPSVISIPIYEGINSCIEVVEASEVYLEGTKNILEHPEFKDLDRAREFLGMLDEKEVILSLLNSRGDIEFSIQIGGENRINEVRDLSLVTTSYSFGNQKIGTIGIIGPTRMDYSKVISSMFYIRKRINEEIIRLIGQD